MTENKVVKKKLHKLISISIRHFLKYKDCKKLNIMAILCGGACFMVSENVFQLFEIRALCRELQNDFVFRICVIKTKHCFVICSHIVSSL
jgi:hypothetical protein